MKDLIVDSTDESSDWIKFSNPKEVEIEGEE